MEIFVKYSVDAILLILLITNILDSARKGFFCCVLSLVCVFAAIFASVTFSQPLAEWSYDNIFSAQIEAEIEQALEDGINSSSVARAVTSVLEVIPGVLTTQLEEMGIDINALTENISCLLFISLVERFSSFLNLRLLWVLNLTLSTFRGRLFLLAT